MTTLAIHLTAIASDKRQRRKLIAGAAGTPVTSLQTIQNRLLLNQQQSITYFTQVVISLQGTMSVKATFGNNPLVDFGMVSGFLVLPGPGIIIIANRVASKDADGGINFIAVAG